MFQSERPPVSLKAATAHISNLDDDLGFSFLASSCVSQILKASLTNRLTTLFVQEVSFCRSST